MRALWLRSVESSVKIKNIMGYISIADRRTLVSIWSQDRKRSQTIVEDRTMFYLLRSSAISIAGSQAIAEVCFHMNADDRRTFCGLRSAIVCDHMETSLNWEYPLWITPLEHWSSTAPPTPVTVWPLQNQCSPFLSAQRVKEFLSW